MRQREQLFVAEGIKTVQTLVERGCRLHRLLVDADRLDSVPAFLFEAARKADSRVLAATPSIFADLADVETAQPVIGVFEIPEFQPPSDPSVVVVLDGIQDPGNLGSILRTCAAAQVDAVLVGKGTTDVYGPKVIRATAGEFTTLPIFRATSPETISSPFFAGFPTRIIVAERAAPERHTEIDWSPPFILVLGSEGSGPSPEWSEAATDRVRIEMANDVESLNVAAAAAVLLFEARRGYAFS